MAFVADGVFAKALKTRTRHVLLWSLPFWLVTLAALIPFPVEGRLAPALGHWFANMRSDEMAWTGWIAVGLYGLTASLAIRIT